MSPQPLIIVLGSTASGKTKLAVSIANHFNGEIISADSRQIFTGMDIGTGKDLSEYQLEEKKIPYHLIDIKLAGEKYNVNAFKEDFYKALENIGHSSKLPILCGGTGMYIHSILQNHELTAVPKNEQFRLNFEGLTKQNLQQILNKYPEKLRSKADYSSSKRLIRAIEVAEFLKDNQIPKIERPEINPLVIGLQSSIENRRNRIIDRLDLRLKNGLIEEVETLMENGVNSEILTFYGLEYKYVVSFLKNEIDFNTLKERLGIAICQFAKRQMTFFRKMEKDGIKINWLNADDKFDEIKLNAIELIDAKFDVN